MKSDTVIAAFRSLLSGDREHGIQVIQQIEAQEQQSGRTGIALQLRRLLQSSPRTMMRLPDAPPEIRVYQADKSLEDLVLPEAVRRSIARLIAEHRRAEILRDNGLQPRTTVLLYGPSGNGKTALVSAIANALSLPLAIVNYGETVDSHLGETGKNIAKLMKFARSRPCVILFDEADSLLRSRGGGDGGSREMDRCVNQLLIELDDRPRNVVFAFASNFDDCLDSAFRRRVEIDMELPAPTEEARRQFIRSVGRRWPFLSAAALSEMPLQPSFAECEQAVEDAARDCLLDEPFRLESAHA